jgi:ABC-type branched-subunit amino acid transport system ATPase component
MILRIKNLTGGYTQGNDILQGVDLEVEQGDSVGIIGLNGSGKSTFAKAIMDCLPYRQGSLFFNGTDISKKSTQELSSLRIALFMQGGRIFEELSVYENLLFAAKNKQKIEAIKKYFIFLQNNTIQLRKMRADKLSGGERHQLALAMCVLKDPALLILDEPSAGLSPLAVNEMYQTLEALRAKSNLTTILIEQNISRAVDFCSSVNLLKNGKIVYASEKSPEQGKGVHLSENQSLKEIEKIMFNM